MKYEFAEVRDEEGSPVVIFNAVAGTYACRPDATIELALPQDQFMAGRYPQWMDGQISTKEVARAAGEVIARWQP